MTVIERLVVGELIYYRASILLEVDLREVSFLEQFVVIERMLTELSVMVEMTVIEWLVWGGLGGSSPVGLGLPGETPVSSGRALLDWVLAAGGVGDGLPWLEADSPPHPSPPLLLAV
ncbi:hypothetical protein NDU88_000461 [Pleurodeles waltl]|uniref:Uncharacterized protein n=1 Tax=Pleurodeles waltl TaxID=8319 RepID=A0AAV7KP00_PLEWA|nr:hypothetical protein NDU88_000461 [Pleurodeles waltl]